MEAISDLADSDSVYLLSESDKSQDIYQSMNMESMEPQNTQTWSQKHVFADPWIN